MAKKKSTESVSKYIPELGLSLAKYSGKQLVERLGKELVSNTVAAVLCGGNVRDLTEGLTHKRILLSNVSLLVAFLKAEKEFGKNLHLAIAEELRTGKLKSEEKVFLQWLMGLTIKGVQNILRSDEKHVEKYLEELEKSFSSAAKQSQKEFGSLTAEISLNKNSYSLNWLSILHLFSALGTQTLAIRGSEKSLYGKLFEKLILGSLLSILGFELIDPSKSTKSTKVFWLSQRETKRESDATLLYKPGKGVRFDIGFIGPGNTEISLDKVSRFEREMDFGRKLHFMSTIILVDRIGEGSRITELAKRIDGTIIQMSMNFWVKEICLILKATIGFDHKLLKLSNEESLEFINAEMQKIDLNAFV
jgi:hypothetical protein